MPTAATGLSVASSRRHNLPSFPTALIGRERERDQVLALLAAHRLVTLTGPGGVGKTRLALAVAEAALDAYPDGTWLVELATLTEPSLVAGAVAHVLGVIEEPRRPLIESLTDASRHRQLLLVLDNCEHLLAACTEVAGALLQAAPGLRVLVTSRQALGLSHERRLLVSPLGLPTPSANVGLDELVHAPAVALFVARAQAVEPTFALNADNAATVAAICTRVDGLPLAIELAAARIRTRAPGALLEDLGSRLQVLVGGRRGLAARQQTVRGLIDWSYTLLSPGEQALFARLSVFAGGWTVEAAQVICPVEDDLPMAVAEGLASLVEKSLVHQDGATGRYSTLETLNEYARYALERLAGERDAAAVCKQHASYFLALAEQAELALGGPEHGVWLARLEAEHDNLRTAWAWAREREAGEFGLRLAGALRRFWLLRGYLSEGCDWLEAALTAAAPASALVRTKALIGSGMLTSMQGDYDRALISIQEALALSRQLGDRHWIAFAHQSLGWLVERRGDYALALKHYEQSLSLRRELDDNQGVAKSLEALGWVVGQLGDHERALALFEEALTLQNALGSRDGIADALEGMGVVAYMRGDFQRAVALHEEGLALRRELGDKVGTAVTLDNLGNVEYLLGNYARARAVFEESLLLSHATGARDLVAAGLECLAWTASSYGWRKQAAQIGGAAAALREALGVPISPEQRTSHDQAVQAMRGALGEEAFAAAWAAGRAMPLDQAISLALSHRSTTP
jgi:predicted ATPase/Tfp pilus assembly protein PilF